MTIGDDQQHWHGLPIREFPQFDEKITDELPAADSVAWRIAVNAYDGDEQWESAFARFTEAVDIARVRAIIVGAWSDVYENGPEEVIAALAGAKERMPALRALFLGDIDSEECEISWIKQACVTPLLDAFPELEELAVRGSDGLTFPAVRHGRLRSLTFESGGLPVGVVRGIAASDLPALEHLDLWLGTSEYGGDAAVTDLEPFFAGTRLPRLRYLALRNSEIQDEIAEAMASAPVVARLEVLDLSMGVLTDEGATALLAGQPLTHLKKLDLHHNFLSEALSARVRETLEPAGVEVCLDPEDADDDEEEDGTVWRYVAVGE
ncbi:STM4015 family protein [Streptomyces longisporoflavus]|uniref:STM4015 family protein n=1 Tax=Streptomyces longisporoflavus TaxID=28044 RepID=A0ABW7QI69_9ACTN